MHGLQKQIKADERGDRLRTLQVQREVGGYAVLKIVP